MSAEQQSLSQSVSPIRRSAVRRNGKWECARAGVMSVSHFQLFPAAAAADWGKLPVDHTTTATTTYYGWGKIAGFSKTGLVGGTWEDGVVRDSATPLIPFNNICVCRRRGTLTRVVWGGDGIIEPIIGIIIAATEESFAIGINICAPVPIPLQQRPVEYIYARKTPIQTSWRTIRGVRGNGKCLCLVYGQRQLTSISDKDLLGSLGSRVIRQLLNTTQMFLKIVL